MCLPHTLTVMMATVPDGSPVDGDLINDVMTICPQNTHSSGIQPANKMTCSFHCGRVSQARYILLDYRRDVKPQPASAQICEIYV